MHTLNKKQYAEQYDQVAKELYRFAFCLLGDAGQAGKALAEAFSDGWAFPQDAPFRQRMMRTVWLCSLRCTPASGERYRQALCAATRCAREETHSHLFEMLGTMRQEQRASLLLAFLFGMDSCRAAWVLEMPQGRVEAMLKELCAAVCERLPA